MSSSVFNCTYIFYQFLALGQPLGNPWYTKASDFSLWKPLLSKAQESPLLTKKSVIYFSGSIMLIFAVKLTPSSLFEGSKPMESSR